MYFSQLFVTLQADMEEKILNQVDAALQETAFREKVAHYIVCFIDSCPLREQCLRWLVGQYVETTPYAYTAVNPRHPNTGTEQCELFRKNQRVLMKKGLKHLYHEMPGYKEKRIRWLLISMWGRKKYYEVRKGDRLMTPEMQQDVIDACRHHDWQGPIVFDGEEIDWDW